MESLKEEVYNSIAVRSYIFKCNGRIIEEALINEKIYITFLLTLVSILNFDNIFLLDDTLMNKVRETVNTGYLKFNCDTSIINMCRKKINNYMIKTNNTNHNLKCEQIYYWMIEEKNYRDIDNIKLTKEQLIELNIRDIDNYGALIDINDNFDDLELFSFISTALLICNCYKDLFHEIPSLKDKIIVISKYLDKNNKYDIRYKKYINEYYDLLLDRLEVKENKKIFRIVK